MSQPTASHPAASSKAHVMPDTTEQDATEQDAMADVLGASNTGDVDNRDVATDMHESVRTPNNHSVDHDAVGVDAVVDDEL